MKVRAIKELLFQFENRTLPIEKWTHEAHLIIALCYIKKYKKEEAICYLRSGIISYNVAVGTKNTPTSGYHETITLFWVELISTFIQKHQQLKLEELIEVFLASKYASKTIFLEYYTKEKLFSVAARANWLAPNKVSSLEKLYF